MFAGHSDLGHCASSSRDRHPVVNPKMFSCSDSNIHRSSLQKPQQQTFAGDGTAARDTGGEGGGGTLRRGQFPYAYIRSKLAVLPEEQNGSGSGQVSRRESMNRPHQDEYRFTSSRSECGLGQASGRHDDDEDDEDDDVPSVYEVRTWLLFSGKWQQ